LSQNIGTKMIMFTLQYDELSKRFHAHRQEIDGFGLPADDCTPIVAEAFGEFLIKYRLNELGTIKVNRERMRAFYLDVFDPDRNYRPMYLEMKNALVKQSKEEVDQLLALTQALEEAGL